MMFRDRNNCSTILSTSTGAQRVNGGKACKCNQIAYDTEPDICDILCPGSISGNDCYCVDYNHAGPFCYSKVCKLGNVAYCQEGSLEYARQPCSDNVNYGKMNDITFCPCGENGQLVGDTCVCNAHYEGVFCDNNSSIITKQYGLIDGTNDRNNSVFRFGTFNSKGPQDYSTTLIAVVLVVIVGLVTCCIMMWCVRRRRAALQARYGSGPPVQAPAGSTYSAQGYPVQGYPIQGYIGSSPGVVTTYTFQAPGGGGSNAYPVQANARPAHTSYPVQPSAPIPQPTTSSPMFRHNFGDDGGQSGDPAPPTYDEAVQNKQYRDE